MATHAELVPRASPLRAPALRRGVLVRVSQLVLQLLVTVGVMFACAGSLSWGPGWLYLGVWAGSIAALAAYVAPRNPEVIAARGRLHQDTARFDKVLLPFYSASSAAIFVVGALDSGRYGWAPLGWPWSLLGAALLVVSVVPVAGAMAVNRNLEPTVRIQSDRGHEVATTGPYRVVRHPMYAASLVQFPAIALVLGSTWALVPALATGVCVVVRTALEDRLLRRELPGYEAYAQRTRYRLLPGVW